MLLVVTLLALQLLLFAFFPAPNLFYFFQMLLLVENNLTCPSNIFLSGGNISLLVRYLYLSFLSDDNADIWLFCYFSFNIIPLFFSLIPSPVLTSTFNICFIKFFLKCSGLFDNKSSSPMLYERLNPIYWKSLLFGILKIK